MTKRLAVALAPAGAGSTVTARIPGTGWVLRRAQFVKAVLRSAPRVRDAQPRLRRLAAHDGTLTILFSDIEDSTALNHQLGDRAWLEILGAHDQIVRASAGKHGGHIVKSRGDGFMIAFASPSDAIRSAIEVQRVLASEPRRLRGTPITVRIGVHTGPALVREGDLFGRNVALAARVADQARGGEILVTAEASEATEAGELVFTDRREVELKGLPGSHPLVAVGWQAC